ncbi:hypothetical protein PVAP13_4KG226600 [Panicum virgatum]|uniref:Uncharacterized protein n=1 Tax=Panicum virgatum TaxID=38727 RepID=A0A8T0TGF8_PANVG|nr:hypothetical protein PVAP13_4KG226600 [Panicum virgatum]
MLKLLLKYIDGRIPNTSRPLAITTEKGLSACIKCLLLNDEEPHIVDEIEGSAGPMKTEQKVEQDVLYLQKQKKSIIRYAKELIKQRWSRRNTSPATEL